jgi:hypothetical protein
MRYFYLTIFCCFSLLLSCSKSKLPSGVLEPEKMQDVYWDFLQADVFANEFVRKDSSKSAELENARLLKKIFKIHHVSRETFYKSYQYYLNHQVLMKNMIDTMLVRQKREEEKPKSTSAIKAVQE